MFKLKGKIILATLTILGIVAFIACQKETNIIENTKQTLTVEDFKFVGVEHNNGLDYIFDNLKLLNQNDGNKSTIESIDITILIKKYASEYIESKNSNSIVNFETKKGIDLIHRIKTENQLKFANSELNLYPDSLKANYSTGLIILLDELDIVMKNENTDLLEAIRAIEKIENNESIDNLSDMEKMIIFTSCSMAKSSLSYWNENYDKWKYLFGNNQKSWWPDWKEIGLSDAGGAVIGATHLAISGTGAAMLAGGPAGWTGIGLVVVGYGLEASAVSAFLSLF